MTTAHHPSASNNYYWPEIYTDMPIMWTEEGTRPHPYFDTPLPRRFGKVSSLDPEVFSSIAEFVEELLAGTSSGRYSPLEVAGWLERAAADTDEHLAAIRSVTPDPESDLRRLTIDVAILAELGRFFAEKLRAGVFYELHDTTGSRAARGKAVGAYRSAVRAWRTVPVAAGDAYTADLTFGPEAHLRGHWNDRMDAIEADLRDMEERRPEVVGPEDDDRASRVLEAAARPLPDVEVAHDPPTTYRPRADLPLEVEVRGPDASTVTHVVLRYRPMNQALAYAALDMAGSGRRFVARVPGEELDGAYPLAYAFVLRTEAGIAWRHPGLGPDLGFQPYVVVPPLHNPPAGPM
ncbi:MAG: hypothetical protein ACRDG8_13775 [Actinomycetota bacterium]